MNPLATPDGVSAMAWCWILTFAMNNLDYRKCFAYPHKWHSFFSKKNKIEYVKCIRKKSSNP